MKFLPVVLLSAITVSPLLAMDLDFYIGTYTKTGKSQGIYHAALNTDTGAISVPTLAAEVNNPTFLKLHPDGKHLYAAAERGTGAVAGFEIQPDGKLRALGEEPFEGRGNCHVYVDSTGKFVFSANYGSGSIAMVPLKPDGTPGDPAVVIQHVGTGPNPSRQEGPHAHSVYQHGAFLYSCDLGTDDIFVYKFDPAKGTLTPNTPPSAKVPPGAGPRHIAFHPTAPFLYVNGEMGNNVTAFTLDADKGTMTQLQTISTLPADYADAAKNGTAEILCHPSGKFLYVSNRGHDSIAVYAIGVDGKLTNVEYAPAHVGFPRGMNLTPDGAWLVIGGQNSDTLAAQKVDPQTGKLTFVSEIKGVGAPVSIEFVPKK